MVNALLSQLFLECVAGLNDRKGCIFTNDMKLTRQNMKYFVFILSAMKSESALFAKCVQTHKEFVVVFKKLLVHTCIHTYLT